MIHQFLSISTLNRQKQFQEWLTSNFVKKLRWTLKYILSRRPCTNTIKSIMGNVT